MSPAPFPIAAAGESLRWENLPPPWALALLVVPAALLLVWLAYRGEDLEPRRRAVLWTLRVAAVLAAVLLLFGPYMERTVTKVVRSHLVVLVDTSASMAVTDDVAPDGAGPLARATGVPEGDLRKTSRLDLARRALLGKDDADSVLEKLRRDFTLHVYGFAGEPRTLWSADETREEGSGAGLREALGTLRADGAATRIGDATIATLEDYLLRVEPLAGVVLVSDGRQTSGTRSSREAAEAARAFLQKASGGQRGVPIFPVVAGDPSSSRNVQVRNLVAPEVVLARDDASFEFDVAERGFDGETGVLRLMFTDPPGENATLVPGEVHLAPGEAGVRVKGRHRFDRPGLYRVRVGVPPLPGERVTEDNWVDHQIRVVDRKVKVLYVDGRPRREWESLQRALTRDSETLLVHTLQLEGTDVPQPRTEAPGWGALPVNRFPTTRKELFDYDVVILGDVDYRSPQFADTPEEGAKRLEDLRDFVEAGGGLLCIAGEYHMPLEYRRTPLAEVLPVIVDADEPVRTRRRTVESFNLRLTPEGRDSPLMRIDEDPKRSADLWETMTRWRQWWYFPVRRAASGARVLAVHPAGEEEAGSGQPDLHSNRYGPHVLVATKSFGLGRSLWIGSDELWRMRYGVGDQFYYAFYAKAIRYLASYRLLGGNRRVKIHPERQVYYLDEPVGIVAHVVGEDYRPPSPLEKPKVAAVVTWPDRTEHALDLLPVPQGEGEAPLGLYRGSFSPTLPGAYSVAPDPAEVPGETPEPKSFAVQSSAEEQRDPGVDAEALEAMAATSGGRSFTLATVKDLPGAIPTRKSTVPVEARPDPLTNQWWIPVALTLILAAEWILRKRWRLL